MNMLQLWINKSDTPHHYSIHAHTHTFCSLKEIVGGGILSVDVKIQ